MTIRRIPALAAAGLVLALALTACGRESDNDPEFAEDSSSETNEEPAEEPSEEPAEGVDGELPAWAPAVLTEGDEVTGFDFTGTPAPGAELEVVLLTEGDGAVVEAGQTISVYYVGQTYDGTDPDNEPFDGNYGSGSPIQFGIGVGQVIPGWDQALVGQKIGSRVLMSIPSDLAYGDEGRPPVIPGGATLYFVVDIVDAQ